MYLKRLEMVGFKSFAERTRLEFEPGIIAIIGPNGCGKSNVVDAIRWCLGEMSAKSLRSKVLLDVIFNGSANRAPTNLSEVSLTFDNSQNRLPVDFSEVTITRRLFRSGESEYYMNKVQCRLKDIKELFLDTGIGEEGYSIMEQGRVEYVLNARPEDRRELFEEAAGVSKYKARREEALRKMERTQLDLDRLADVIAMTKEQMDKIEAAVRKAKQYQKLQEDLKSMEINHCLFDAAQLEQEMGTLRAELKTLEDELQVKTTQIDQREAEASDLRFTETETGEKLVSLNRKLSDIDGSIGLAEQRQTTAREREEEIRGRDVRLDAEMAQGRARLEELDRIRAEARAALDTEKATADEVAEQLERDEAAHQATLEIQRTSESAAKGLQDSLWKNNQDASRAHNEISSKRGLEVRLDTEIKILQKDYVKAEEKLRAAREILARFDEDLGTREAEVQRLEAAAGAARAAVERADASLSASAALERELRERYYQTKAQLETQEQLAASDVYAQGTQAILAAGLPGVSGPIGKLISVSSSDEAVVRQALGGHVNDLVADTLDDAQRALAFLTEQRRGRARFLVLDRLPRRESAPAVGAGQRPVVDLVRADSKFQPALNYLLGRLIASGGSLYGDGVLEGGSEAAPTLGADPLLRASLQDASTQIEAGLESLARQKASNDDARRQLIELWEKGRQAAEAARVQRDFFRQEKDKELTQVTLLQDESRLITGETERMQAERAEAEQAIAAMERNLGELASTESRLRSEWQALQETIQRQQQETSASAASLAVARDRAEKQAERLQWREGQLNAAEAEWLTLSESLEAKQGERATSQQRIEEQLNLQEQSRIAIEKMLVERAQVEKALEAVHAERTTLHDRLSAAETDLQQLRERGEELRSQIQDKKLQLSHAEFRRESTETSLKEKYQLTIQEARERYVAPPTPVPQADLDRLRRRVESLGAVNLAAPEEHAQLEERYNFLLSQQQDLLKAKDDLHQTILKINATTREHFRETFNKVRENFQAIYGQLFQGGVADVRLTDESDALNAGVEIFAQPPGKKLQNIALLSGGEKALTAVALLFAFFMVRPAPFCVLDEVDAPLDEANVTRFVTLIKAFTHQSQFLIITHNKRSMEIADMLYGVTMETLGVSKLLSARLKKDGGLADTATPDAVIAAGKKQGGEAPAKA